MTVRVVTALVATAIFSLHSTVQAQIPAFPGAEGFGQFATGGRGGDVYIVTNLNDSGPGSLREAVEASGPRTIVFAVSGNIELQSQLRIKNGDLTIAGQTAPGDGICLQNYGLVVDADNVIIRYIRVRPGDTTRTEQDAIWVKGYHRNIIIDHCSFSWSIDETASAYDSWNLTIQWCFITESLHFSYHSKGPHGYGGIWGGMGASFHHNLIAHHYSRTPRFNGSRYHHHPEWEIVDFRNNVIYNWASNSAYGGEGGNHNLIANYYKYGPATQSGSKRYRIVNPYDDQGRWFVQGNFVYGFPEITADNWAGGVQPGDPNWLPIIRVDEPFPAASVVTHDPEVAFELVLADAGASRPKRDPIDERIAEETRTGTATYGGKLGAGKGIIDSQNDVGGWPPLLTYDVPEDNDRDGMADAWERAHGLDPTDPNDHREDADGDGYTNLEEYINELCWRTDYLAAPAELTVSPVSTNELMLQWREAIPNEEGFAIERSTSDSTGWTMIATVGPNDTLFVDRGLSPDTVYYYRVRAFAGSIFSLYTNVASGMPSATGARSSFDRPTVFQLLPVSPNPFTDETRVAYELRRDATVSVVVYDLLGRRIATLADGRQTAGRHTLIWRAGNAPAGVYFVVAEANGERKIVRALRLRR